MPMRSGSTTAEEFALPKVKEGLSQLILERKTCYGHRDRPGYCDRTGLKTDMAIVTVLASKPTWLS